MTIELDKLHQAVIESLDELTKKYGGSWYPGDLTRALKNRGVVVLEKSPHEG